MMKGAWLGGITGLLALGGISAQIVVPASPRKMIVRPIGGGSTGGVDVLPQGGAGAAKVHYTTRIVLAEERPWTSTDGKTLFAKMIAFEDLVAETPPGAAQPGAVVPPANPTVVRDGKIRLLASGKPFELALERLVQADRDFVEQVRARHAKPPPPPKP